MNDCVFCRIVAGEEPAKRVEEWPDAIAIVPLNPVTPGHTLVIPKVHVRDFTWDSLVTAMAFRRAAEFADEHRNLNGAANLITSAGAAATQTILHLHVHVVPRRADDGLALPWTGQKVGAQ